MFCMLVSRMHNMVQLCCLQCSWHSSVQGGLCKDKKTCAWAKLPLEPCNTAVAAILNTVNISFIYCNIHRKQLLKLSAQLFFTKRRTCANTAHPNRAAFKICTNISMTDVSASLRVFHASIATPVPSYVANEHVDQACATAFKSQCQLTAPTITYDHAKTSLCSIHTAIAVFPKFNFAILLPLKALGAVLQNGLDLNMVQQTKAAWGH